MKKDVHCDVIIIGGGPAGSVAAALLAQYGRRVAVLEKARFPRYHVGESLIPHCYFPLNRVGMIEKMNASSFTRKYSVQFAGISGKISQPFYFHEHHDHPSSQTWQVERSEFDRMLLDNAREKGAAIYEGIKAREIIEDDGAVTGVRAEDSSGIAFDFFAPITVDASGRNGFFSTKKGWRIRDPQLQKIAMWTYYEGAMRDSGYDEGATTVAYLPEKGWFWYIPQQHNIVSVGLVAERDYLYAETRDPEIIFQGEIEKNAWIRDHLAPGHQTAPVAVTGDYSYRSRYCAADGVVLTGDAFAFLDPVFSSGLYFALLGGEYVGDAVERALQNKDYGAGQFSEYADKYRHAIEAMRKLVYAFYDGDFNFGMLLKKYPELSGAVTDILIGNVEQDFEPLFSAISEFATVPAPLPHGAPWVKS